MKLKDPRLLKTQALIDGQWLDADDGSSIPVVNPADGEVITRVARCQGTETRRAIEAASGAFQDWRSQTAKARSRALRRWFDLIIAHHEDLAVIMTTEQGKPLAESRGEVAYGAAFLEWFAEEAPRVYGDTIPGPAPDKRVVTLKQPVGVVACITPWNFPIAMLTRKVGPALAAGCTVVCKPASATPLSALAIAELAVRADIPAGVVNVLAAGNDLGQWMTEHPDIDKISFTGSVATGKKVLATASDTLKRVTLELGGNDPAIILDDADPRAIARSLFFACFVNSGQVCMAVKRIYAHESVYDELCSALVDEANAAKVGNGLEPDTKLGPLQNRMQFDKVSEILEETKNNGATILTGGEIPQKPGYFIPPTLVTDVDDDSRIVSEEQFGPVVPILKFTDPEDALRRANDTRYGLSGSVWTSDPARGKALAERMEVGTAWVNQHRAVSAYVPFGGAKQSGLGRQYSIIGLKGYMEPQVVSVSKV